ncbi:hypothetical protein NO932_11780 [Pelagibacterium sp. 26DY04]|nr:hypothetical protein [Pelagibacterium sp. 26DY04]WMT85608.1 hypothetical protein NO932_11780 [Pelagibacterium sp. 26DY04]
MTRNNLLAALYLTPALALAIAWAVEQRFDMPFIDAVQVLFS